MNANNTHKAQRNKAKMTSTFRLLPLFTSLTLFCACDISQGCDEEFDPASGNIDRVADMVLVTPPDESNTTFLVMSNPEIEQLRVFNATQSSFSRSPNVYSPLSILTGPSTHRLAVAKDDQTRVYALDSSDDEVLVIRTHADDEGPAFVVSDRYATGRAPSDIAAGVIDEVPTLFVSTPDLGEVQVFENGEQTGAITFPEGARPARLSLDPTGATLVVTDAAFERVHLVSLESRSVDRTLNIGARATGVSTGVIDVGDGLAPVALLEQNGSQVALVRLYRPGFREDKYTLMGRVAFDAPVSASFVPDHSNGDLAPKVCCLTVSDDDASDAWASVMTATGVLHYVRVDAPAGFVMVDEGVYENADNALPRPRLFERSETLSVTLVSTFDDEPELCVRPTATLDALTPARAPESIVANLTYEGTFGAALPTRSLGASQISVPSDAVLSALEQDDIATLTLSEDLGGSCESSYSARVGGIVDGGVQLVGLDATAQNCLESSEESLVQFQIEGAYVVTVGDQYARLPFENRGDCIQSEDETRLEFGANATVLDVAGLTLGFVANDLVPPEGSSYSYIIDTETNALTVALASIPQAFGDFGFGTTATLPTAMVGGVLEADENDELSTVRRQFIATSAGNGILLELAETEVRSAGVVGHQ